MDTTISIGEVAGSVTQFSQRDDSSLLLLTRALGAPPEKLLPALQWHLRARRGGVRGLVNDSLAQRLDLPGVGASRLAQLAAALELATLLALEPLARGDVLCSPASCEQFLLQHLGRRSREFFCGLFLDSRNHLIACEDLFAGTVDGAAVYPRVVVARALLLGASAVIVAHNHPSGAVIPSRADRMITQRLIEALALVDIRLLDHLIIGHGETCSLAQQGEI